MSKSPAYAKIMASGAGPAVQYLSFAADGEAFACGHSRGFATFRTDTAQAIHRGQGDIICTRHFPPFFECSKSTASFFFDSCLIGVFAVT